MAENIRPAGVFDTRYAQDMALQRTGVAKIREWVLLAILLVLPLFTANGPLGLSIIPGYVISTIVSISIFVIAAQGLNILVGYTGQISLGQAAFMAVGAYSGALMAKGFDLVLFGSTVPIGPMSPWLALPLAGLTAGVIGLIFGLPSLRVKGLYLAMATLAAQFIIPWFLENPLHYLTNAPNPLQDIPAPMIGDIRLGTKAEIYYLVVPLTVVMLLLARNIIRTRPGRAFISIRDNDLAAELMGIDVFRYKLEAFFISALFAGVAGALMAFDQNTITSQGFELGGSVELLAMIIIGGAGFPQGALFGVAAVKLLTNVIIPAVGPFFSDLLTALLPFVDASNISTSLQPILFGSALLLFLLFEPRGLAYRWEILRIAWKIRPFSY